MEQEQDSPDAGRTGDAAVDAQLAALDSLDDLPVGEHQEVFAALHEALHRVLDEEPTDA